LKGTGSMDELAVWLLPGTEALLLACLEADFERGLALAARIAANPFQRCTSNARFQDFLANENRALDGLYQLADWTNGVAYLILPINDLSLGL